MLTPGDTADCTVAGMCVSAIPGVRELLAGKPARAMTATRFALF